MSDLNSDHNVSKMKQVRNVTIIGLVLNLLLAVLKIVFSILTGSVSLLADGLDSALDLGTTTLGFFALKIADKPADEEHHFGHEKVENLFSIGIAVILVASSGFIAYQAINKLVNVELLAFDVFNVIIASLSIILKGVLVWINISVGKRIKSPVLVANGLNFRTDILTSIVVLISVTVSPQYIRGFSLYWIDPVIALIISVVIVATAIKITRESASVLLDTSPDEKILQKIEDLANRIEGVKHVEGIRARELGSNMILSDINIMVDPNLTIEQGHDIATNVEKIIKENLPVKYLQVHVEPYPAHKHPHRKLKTKK